MAGSENGGASGGSLGGAFPDVQKDARTSPGVNGVRIVFDDDAEAVLVVSAPHVFMTLPGCLNASLVHDVVVERGGDVIDALDALRHLLVGKADPGRRIAGAIAEGDAQPENARRGFPVPLPLLRPPGRGFEVNAPSPGQAVSADNSGDRAIHCNPGRLGILPFIEEEGGIEAGPIRRRHDENLEGGHPLCRGGDGRNAPEEQGRRQAKP